MKRLFRATITEGNVRRDPKTGKLTNTHLPTGELRDYLRPLGVFGGNNRESGVGREVTVLVDGETFLTDIASDKSTIFRNRTMARRFIERHGPEADDEIIYEEIAPLAFSVSMARDVIPSLSTVVLPSEEDPARKAESFPDSEEQASGDDQSGHDREEERIRRWAQRETRPEQAAFRKGIAERDGLRCSLTGCEVPALLEAAHLDPRGQGGSDHPSNGIIMRVDLHRLFDAGLLRIDADSGRVSIFEEMSDEEYRRYDGAVLTTGADLSNLGQRYGGVVAA